MDAAHLYVCAFVCVYEMFMPLQGRFFQMEDNGTHNGTNTKAVYSFTGSHGTEYGCFRERLQSLKVIAITSWLSFNIHLNIFLKVKMKVNAPKISQTCKYCKYTL